MAVVAAAATAMQDTFTQLEGSAQVAVVAAAAAAMKDMFIQVVGGTQIFTSRPSLILSYLQAPIMAHGGWLP